MVDGCHGNLPYFPRFMCETLDNSSVVWSVINNTYFINNHQLTINTFTPTNLYGAF